MTAATATPEAVEPRVAPGTRDLLVDLGFTLLLALLAVSGLRGAMGGTAPLLIGMAGACVGALAAWLLQRFSIRGFLAVLLVVGVFLLAGSVAVPEDALAGFLPGPATPGAVVQGLVHGWSNLLTTVPPVGTGGGIGVVPYALGFLAGFGGLSLARRRRSSLLPAAPAAVALIGSFLLGTSRPWSVVVQGGAFVAAALVWGSVRSGRDRRAVTREIDWPRVLGGVVMVVLLVGTSLALASHLPGVQAPNRYSLRQDVVPPFDPRDYPSPLGGYRNFRTPAGKSRLLFEVSGLPSSQGVDLRIATMDTYDGVVWLVGGPDQSASGRFERVGTSILPVPPGVRSKLHVQVDGYEDVWVPAAGAIESVRFSGPQAEALGQAFRYNSTTGVGATPTVLDGGDGYDVDVSLPVRHSDSELAGAEVDMAEPMPALPEVPPDIVKVAARISRKEPDPAKQVLAIRDFLRKTGYYSDGTDKSSTAARSAPGHSVFRLGNMLRGPMIGNDEQYAAAMALMARTMKIPARVVLGVPMARGKTARQVHGRDVRAWVEVKYTDLGWQPIFPTPTKKPPKNPKTKVQEQDLAQQEPRVQSYLSAPEDRPDVSKAPKPPKTTEQGTGFHLPWIVKAILVVIGIPLLILGAIVLVITSAKRMRRNRRRARTDPVGRAVGAWAELVDQARDLGVVVGRRRTRVELATAVGTDVWPGARTFADRVDAVVFGPEDPDLQVADGLWQEAERERTAMVSSLPFVQRWKARLSLRSLWPGRPA